MDKNDFKAISELKASDKAVEKAVKSALKAYDSGKVIKMEKTKKLNYKAVSAIAACLVAVVACTAVFGNFGGRNSFTITAAAAEATPDEATPDEKQLNNDFVSIGTMELAGGSAHGVSDDDGKWKYINECALDITANFKCKGENIKYISYEADNNSAIGVDYDKSIYRHSNAIEDTNGFTVGENGKPIVYYRSVTSKYKSQIKKVRFRFSKSLSIEDKKSQKVAVEYYNRSNVKKIHIDPKTKREWREPYWKDSTDKATIKTQSDIVTNYAKLILNKKKVRVVVTYNDGTKEIKNLVFNAKCVSRVVNYKEWDDTKNLDKYGDKDIYLFNKIEVSAKIED